MWTPLTRAMFRSKGAQTSACAELFPIISCPNCFTCVMFMARIFLVFVAFFRVGPRYDYELFMDCLLSYEEKLNSIG